MRTVALIAIESILFFSWCIILFALLAVTDSWRERLGISEGWSTAAFYVLTVGGSVVTFRLATQLLKVFDIPNEEKAGE